MTRMRAVLFDMAGTLVSMAFSVTIVAPLPKNLLESSGSMSCRTRRLPVRSMDAQRSISGRSASSPSTCTVIFLPPAIQTPPGLWGLKSAQRRRTG